MLSYRSCTLCPRRCGVDREAGELGFCRMPGQLRAARAMLHYGEEPPICANYGTGAVFFSGCTLRCRYCQNGVISTGGAGETLTPEALRSAVEQTPAIQALKKQQEQQAAADEQRRQAEAQARVNAELAEIHKLDPTINTVEDLLSMPGAKAFYDLVRKGNSFLDAYRLANFDRLTTARAEAARQQALNNARGKDHLTGTGTPQGTGAATVPPDVKAEYLAFNPDATDAEIQKHYNRYMEKQRKE